MSLRSKEELEAWYKTLKREHVEDLRERRNGLARQALLTAEERRELARLQDELEQLTFFRSDGSLNSEAYEAAQKEEAVWSQFVNKPLSPSDITTLSDHTGQLLARLKKFP